MSLFDHYFFSYRNSHALTHREKKPYRCTYESCSKSYCDNRSLRRHLENHHANDESQLGATTDANQNVEETQMRSGGTEMPVSVDNQPVSSDSQAVSGFPVQSLPESTIHSSASSTTSLFSDRTVSGAISSANIASSGMTQFPTTVADEQHASKQWNEIAMSSVPSVSQAANKYLGNKPPLLISVVQPTISSNFTLRATSVPSYSSSLSNIPQVEGHGTNRLSSSQPITLPPVYPHDTASEAYQSYLAAMAKKKQEEQAAKPGELFPAGVGVGLDVKSIIQQPVASHGLTAPVSLPGQWTFSSSASGSSTPAFNVAPFPPSYVSPTLPTSRYQYPLGANESLLQPRPPLAAPAQPTDAQLLAVLMAAAPPPPSPIFNVNNWPAAAAAAALGMAGSPYLFQQMLAGFMHQAAVSSPLHGLTSGMNYVSPVHVQRPVGSSAIADGSVGQKKEDDVFNSTSKIAIKSTSRFDMILNFLCVILIK